VVSAASYLPSGPLASLALGSGVTETRGFDGRYAPASIALAGVVEKTFTYTTDPVGNVLEITEQGACTPGPIVLENQTVTSEELFVSCTTIEAGNNFAVESPGDVTFHAQGTIALKSGFSVGSGARFVAGSGALPELSRRTYTYQAPQYFLTGADGPWGTLDWSYDKIGNRLAETRNGATDSYQYLVNGAGGNTPILDLINLAVTGTRDYTWGPAGHLEEVAAGANVLDFGADAEGRLSGVDRTAAAAASFSYDGRSFLQTAQETAGGTSSVDPLYDSAGVVHALLRRPSPTDPEEIVVFLYLAGRPVAQLAIDGAGAESWIYLSTDHLGTPLLATADTGTVVWEGGFEPFGGDYQAGTGNGALENGVYLRLPGQWQDTSWQDASSGAGIYYNVHRWYQPSISRYTRPDPLGLPDAVDFDDSYFNLYQYAVQNPLLNADPTGLITVPWGDLPGRCRRRWERKILPRLLNPTEECDDYFCQKLGTDYRALIQGALPIVVLRPGRGGSFGCHRASELNVEPDVIKVGRRSFCGSTKEALHVVVHELGHYADCWNNNDDFQDEQDGCGAEVACFGFSIGKNCKDLGFPTR
jgi:RHS repeat-associated protein